MQNAFDGHVPRAGKCLHCNLPFTYRCSRQTVHKFCAHSCYIAHKKAHAMPPVSCRDCGAGIVREKRRILCDKCYTKAPNSPRFVTKCKECGSEFQRSGSQRKTARFCSYKCKSESQQRSLTMHCALCGKARTGMASLIKNRQYCSPECVRKSRRETKPEKHVREALGRLAIPFIAQHSVGRYVIDFFLPLLNVAVEVDGAYWHTPEKDSKKDRALSQLNIRVIRLRFADSKSFLRSNVYERLRKQLKT